mmetsp:Transcript_24817/g.69690  ORF Transcript_24817/g.69690 Transcript_24817/m.69690 type:complete len:297 (+) Transcript_24817:597-1487(+)
MAVYQRKGCSQTYLASPLKASKTRTLIASNTCKAASQMVRACTIIGPRASASPTPSHAAAAAAASGGSGPSAWSQCQRLAGRLRTGRPRAPIVGFRLPTAGPCGEQRQLRGRPRRRRRRWRGEQHGGGEVSLVVPPGHLRLPGVRAARGRDPRAPRPRGHAGVHVSAQVAAAAQEHLPEKNAAAAQLRAGGLPDARGAAAKGGAARGSVAHPCRRELRTVAEDGSAAVFVRLPGQTLGAPRAAPLLRGRRRRSRTLRTNRCSRGRRPSGQGQVFRQSLSAGSDKRPQTRGHAPRGL